MTFVIGFKLVILKLIERKLPFEVATKKVKNDLIHILFIVFTVDTSLDDLEQIRARLLTSFILHLLIDVLAKLVDNILLYVVI